ncbi:alpha/beta fold hydrolase [Cryobacterium frigoriphilum]|uniref:Alpha/beta fold hydrolase n=1 Tax=Cryobacterium frigoriphilum TaxID=1259150 RepID=A0A4R9A4Q0_9MICO|nr:alpha/beta fold hydrolase [Cryobacterium frigoriphilum]TFD52186.1 alpha/beta fold hydrolase [Cryobacterium frigoriphilum]
MRLLWVLAGAVVTVGVGLAGLGLVIARRLTAPVGERKYDLTIRRVDNSGERPVVILDRLPSTASHGDYCLIVETGNWVKLAPEVEDRGTHLVGREIVGQSREDLAAGQRASWSGIYFETPADAGLQSTDVVVPTDVGPAPAWLINSPEGPSRTWAIHIHGLGSTRAGTLRGVQVASEAGMTSLVVTYRNDGDGPIVGTGRSELGAAEVQDVRAALTYARENGAARVVLFGWSMGAAIALQLAADRRLRDTVVGLVLDSPVLDWVSTIEFNCVRSGLPAWTGALALPWLTCCPLVRVIGLENPVALHKFDWIARADESSVLTLILHGMSDTSSPFELSAGLGALRPETVGIESFPADHTMSWNSAREGWRAAVSTWLHSLAMTG